MKFIAISAAAILIAFTSSNADAAKRSKGDEMFLAICKDTKLVKSEKLTAACSAQEVLNQNKIEAAVKYPSAEVKVLFVNLPK